MIKYQVSLMMLALLCFGVWTGYAQGQRTSPVRQAWEYRIIEAATVEGYTSAAEIQKLLNQGGAEGWELVRVSERLYYFKRPK